ncbi:MAG: pentapeptide repeat-containing protein [Candidatus Saccharimonadales bacterium]
MKISHPVISKNLSLVSDFSQLIATEDGIENERIENESFDQLSLKNFTIIDSQIIKTDFSGTEIDGFGLKNTRFSDCNMTTAKFPDASWHVVELLNSRCSGIQLNVGILKDVLFKGCKLDLSNFRFAKLTNVIFDGCVINEMDFYNAELKNVQFINCEIDRVEFSNSKLHNVDFTESQIITIKGISSLKGAIISNEQLIYLAPYLASQFGIKISE